MSQTDSFRRQHDELLHIVGEMVPLLKADALAKDAGAVRTLLSQLAGKLTVHLAMEDRSLYPRLTSHANPLVSSTARKFMDEMGGIKEVFAGYTKKWASATSIQQDPGVFVSETSSIFAALGKRIASENSSLYEIVDRFDA